MVRCRKKWVMGNVLIFLWSNHTSSHQLLWPHQSYDEVTSLKGTTTQHITIHIHEHENISQKIQNSLQHARV